jgi:hypothetical protein
MATIEIYGPSSHSQSTTAPAFITASVLVRNLGNATGYARMRITGASSATGSFTSIPGGQSAVVVANANVYDWQAGRTITVSAEVDEMSAGYERIGSLGSHRNFRITVAAAYVPPPPPPEVGRGGYDPYFDQPYQGSVLPPGFGSEPPPSDVGRGGYDPYMDLPAPAPPAPPLPPPAPLPPPTYWGGYDPYMDLPAYVSPVIPDWIRAQEEADDGMY